MEFKIKVGDFYLTRFTITKNVWDDGLFFIVSTGYYNQAPKFDIKQANSVSQLLASNGTIHSLERIEEPPIAETEVSRNGE